MSSWPWVAALSLCCATARAEPAPEPACPEGTRWHEDADPASHAIDGAVPARAGWCALEDGVRHGPLRLWWPSGQLMREVQYEAGAASGRLVAFFADGRPELEARQLEGQLDGPLVLWHPTGVRAREMTYDRGRPHGWATYWDEAGRPRSQGAWVAGKKQGVWEVFYDNGVLREVARWDHGRLSGRQLTFSEGGRFVAGACWEAGERRWESRNEAESRTRRCRPW